MKVEEVYKVDVKQLKQEFESALNYSLSNNKSNEDFIAINLQVKEITYLIRLLKRESWNF